MTIAVLCGSSRAPTTACKILTLNFLDGRGGNQKHGLSSDAKQDKLFSGADGVFRPALSMSS